MIEHARALRGDIQLKFVNVWDTLNDVLAEKRLCRFSYTALNVAATQSRFVGERADCL